MVLHITLASLVILIILSQSLVYGLTPEQEKALEETRKLNEQNQQAVKELEEYFEANPPPNKQKTSEQILQEYDQYKHGNPSISTPMFDQNVVWVVTSLFVIMIITIVIMKSRSKISKTSYQTTTVSVIPRIPFNEETKERTLRRQNHRCNICHRLLTVVDFDHIDNDRSNNNPNNCQAVCPTCNQEKERRRQMQY